MSILEAVVAIGTVLLGSNVITALITNIFNRRQANIKAESMALKNCEECRKNYQTEIAYWREETRALRQKVDEIEGRYINRIEHLESKSNNQEQAIRLLTSGVSILTNQLESAEMKPRFEIPAELTKAYLDSISEAGSTQ